jgi:predicted  nucleic acid-binding Zn-ribbon protein
MTRLEGALAQFTEALERLDAALSRRGAQDRGHEKLMREIQALREDRARLAEALDAARADYAALGAMSDDVESRLDSAIRDIRRVLGHA